MKIYEECTMKKGKKWLRSYVGVFLCYMVCNGGDGIRV
jgi:hypothetical protein